MAPQTHRSGKGHPATARAATVAALAVLCGCGPSSERPAAPGPFANLEPVTLRGYSGDAMEPFITRDGRYLLFNNRNDPSVDTQLQLAERVDDVTFDYRGELLGANSTALDGVPSLDSSGTLYFVSTRSYAQDLTTVYRGQFAAGTVSGVGEVPGVSRNEAGWVNFDAEISADGRTLWLVDGHFSAGAALESADLLFATQQGSGFVRSADSARILATVNTPALEYAPAIRADGLELFFTRVENITTGTPALWRTSRPTPQDAFGMPEQVTAASGFVEGPTLSPDGRSLYFHRLENGTFRICRVTR